MSLPTHHLQYLPYGPQIILLPLNSSLQLLQILAHKGDLSLVHLGGRLSRLLDVVARAHVYEDA